MPVFKTEEEVSDLLLKKSQPRVKAILFSEEISKLKKGEGLFISLKEWEPRRTPIGSYFQTKYNSKKEKKVILVVKDTQNGEEGVTLIKL